MKKIETTTELPSDAKLLPEQKMAHMFIYECIRRGRRIHIFSMKASSAECMKQVLIMGSNYDFEVQLRKGNVPSPQILKNVVEVSREICSSHCTIDDTKSYSIGLLGYEIFQRVEKQRVEVVIVDGMDQITDGSPESNFQKLQKLAEYLEIPILIVSKGK